MDGRQDMLQNGQVSQRRPSFAARAACLRQGHVLHAPDEMNERMLHASSNNRGDILFPDRIAALWLSCGVHQLETLTLLCFRQLSFV